MAVAGQSPVGSQERTMEDKEKRKFSSQGPDMLRNCKELLRQKQIYFGHNNLEHIVTYYQQGNEQRVVTMPMITWQTDKNACNIMGVSKGQFFP